MSLQAVSREDILKWFTNICHRISMETSGGLLLKKEKQDANYVHYSAADEIYSGVKVVTTSKYKPLKQHLM